MKRIYIAIALAGLLLASCGETDISGVWTSTPSRLDVSGAADATSTLTMILENGSSSHSEGEVRMSALINVNYPMAPDSSIDSPYEQSVAASASVSGTWTRDGDDVYLALDPGSLSVSVDPDGVAFAQNSITGAQQPYTDSLSRASADRYRRELTPAVERYFFSMNHIDDVKVRNSIMSCEVNDRDVTFRRSDAM